MTLLVIVSVIGILVGGAALWLVYRLHEHSRQTAAQWKSTAEDLGQALVDLRESVSHVPQALAPTSHAFQPILAHLTDIQHRLETVTTTYDGLRDDVTRELHDLTSDLRRLPSSREHLDEATLQSIATRFDQRISSLHHRFSRELTQTLTEAAEDSTLPTALFDDLSLLLTRAINEAAQAEQSAYSDAMKEAILRLLSENGETLTALEIMERLTPRFPADAVFATLERMTAERIIHTGYSRILFKTSIVRLAY